MDYIQLIENSLRKKNITAKKMLLDLGYSDSLISQWKKGSEPSAFKLKRIAEYLELSIDYLLTGKNPPMDAQSVSSEAAELARRWDALDADGKALVRAELVRAEDRRTKKDGAK